MWRSIVLLSKVVSDGEIRRMGADIMNYIHMKAGYIEKVKQDGSINSR